MKALAQSQVLREYLARRLPLEFRMDAFQRDVLPAACGAGLCLCHHGRVLELTDAETPGRRAPAQARARARGGRLRTPARHIPMDLPLSVRIYRKHVRHERAKNFQLDLFSPDDGHFEYYA